MDKEWMQDILGGLVVDGGEIVSPLCARFSCALMVGGVGVLFMVDEQHGGTLGFSPGIADDGEGLQLSLGEGPGVDAHRVGHPVGVPDLAKSTGGRWIEFGRSAVASGIAAVFGFPLAIGAARVGAMTVYQATPGELSDDVFADCLMLADVTTHLVIGLQADAAPGALAKELAEVRGYRPEIHQATGMAAAQLGVSMAEALVRLRAYAYAEERPLIDVSCDIVDLRLRMTS